MSPIPILMSQSMFPATLRLSSKTLMALVKPQHVIPIGGTYHHMIQYRQLARSLGYPDDHIHLLDNGEVLHISPMKSKSKRLLI